MVRNRSTNTLKHQHEEHENMQLTSKPAPSSLPLQGWGRFSRTSFDLLSSKGVWQPRKLKRKQKKVKQRRGRRSQAGEQEASPVTLLIEVD